MSLGIAKESDQRGVRWAGNAHPAESKEYYNSNEKVGVTVKGTLLRPFEVNPSSEATVLVQGRMYASVLPLP
jgi:hypothetical protein